MVPIKRFPTIGWTYDYYISDLSTPVFNQVWQSCNKNVRAKFVISNNFISTLGHNPLTLLSTVFFCSLVHNFYSWGFCPIQHLCSFFHSPCVLQKLIKFFAGSWQDIISEVFVALSFSFLRKCVSFCYVFDAMFYKKLRHIKIGQPSHFA